VLDGTTIEELERHRLKTLKLVVRQLNEDTVRHLSAERERAKAAEEAEAEHDRQVQETANRLNFEDDDVGGSGFRSGFSAQRSSGALGLGTWLCH